MTASDLARISQEELSHAQPLGESVIPSWVTTLSFQQQSVLLLALRGPDGVRKYHPAKPITVAYRGTMLRAAERQRFLYWGEPADEFMSLDGIADEHEWRRAIKTFFQHVDELPHHYVGHIAHAAQIIGYKHPDARMRGAWRMFYDKWCHDLHLNPESEAEMDNRLGDWGRAEERLKGKKDMITNATLYVQVEDELEASGVSYRPVNDHEKMLLSSSAPWEIDTGWPDMALDAERMQNWVEDRFGESSFKSACERADRMLEEAIEAQQAVYALMGKDASAGKYRANRLVYTVYAKEPGHPSQEIAGLMTCVLALARRLGIPLPKVTKDEITRIEGLSKEYFSARHQIKVDAGVALQHETPGE